METRIRPFLLKDFFKHLSIWLHQVLAASWGLSSQWA